MKSPGSDNFELSFFALYPKMITGSEFYFFIWNYAWKRQFRVIVFCTILKTITQTFSKPAKAFNLENIGLVCSQTHKVNNDFSNSVNWITLSEFRAIIFLV